MKDALKAIRNILRVNIYLLPSKLSYFFYVSRSAYQPYMLLFLNGIGLTPTNASLVNGLHFLGFFSVGPIFGYIADSYNKHRLVARTISIISLVLMISIPIIAFLISNSQSNHCPVNNNKNVTNYHVADSTYANDQGRLFWVILVAFFLASFFGDAIAGFLDSAVVEACSKHNAHFAHQRIFAAVGFSYGVFVSGIFTDNFPVANVTCYAGIFIALGIHCSGLTVASDCLIKNVVLGKAKAQIIKSSNTWAILKSTLERPKNIIFLITVSIIGIEQGCFVNFQFLYFKEECNATSMYLSLYTFLGSVSAMITYMVSPRIYAYFHNKWLLFSCACLAYFVRYIFFPFTENLNLLLPTAFLQSFHLLFVVGNAHYVRDECPIEIHTTLFGICNALMKAFGYMSTNIIGGYAYDRYGGKAVFFFLPMLALTWGLIIGAYGILKKARKNREKSYRNLLESSNNDFHESYVEIS